MVLDSSILNQIDFSKPQVKNGTYSLDTRVLEKIDTLANEFNCSKSDIVNKVLLKAFSVE